MGIRLGEIDSNQILQNEFRIGVLEKLVEKILNRSPGIINLEDMQMAKKDTVGELRKNIPTLAFH